MIFLGKPQQYSFRSTVKSHGWCQLAPFQWDDTQLRYAWQQGDHTQQISIQEIANHQLQIESTQEMEQTDLHWMLRLDDDLSEFYAICQAEPQLAYLAEAYGGRLLRSATVWEDLVKVITTTNTAWSGTIRMCQKLVDNWGQDGAFPMPQALAQRSPEELKTLGGLGYRADYIFELAVRVSEGKLDLEWLKETDMPTPELYKWLRQIKGVGDYAATSMLMLLGRTDRVPVDSIAHSHVSRYFYAGERVTPAQIQACFARFGRYAGLAYWFWKFED